MKKLLSLFTVFLLLSSSVAPIYAQNNAEESDDTDQQLAELLEGLEGSDQVEGQAESDTTMETQSDTGSDEAESDSGSTAGEEEHQAAEDILDMIENSDWEFAAEKKTEVKSVTADSITVSTTAVLYQGEPIEEYRISYSNNTIADTTNFDDIQFAEVTPDEPEEGEDTDENMVTVTLDGLEAETRYYMIISPIHPTDPNADGFNLSSPEVAATTDPEQPTITATTKVFQDVTHTQNENSITVEWEPTDLVANGVIQVRHKDETNYTKVGTVSMESGSYTFTVSQSGNHFLKMQGVNEDGDVVGQEQVQNIKVEEFDQPEEPVENAPQVGPTTDLIMMLFILAIIIYFVYRFRRIER